MEVLGIGAIMLTPMITMGIALYYSYEATKDIGKEID